MAYVFPQFDYSAQTPTHLKQRGFTGFTRAFAEFQLSPVLTAESRRRLGQLLDGGPEVKQPILQAANVVDQFNTGKITKSQALALLYEAHSPFAAIDNALKEIGTIIDAS